MARAFLFVLDSFGIGGAADAERYGDAGADTFGHIFKACAEGRADREGLRKGPLAVPNMMSLGIARAARAASGLQVDSAALLIASAFHGAAQEVSSGKDTPSGHWEIAGLPVRFDWGYFPDTVPAFPPELTEAIIREGKVPGILGNCHAPGTEIIERFGEEHIRTGSPICYTSVDSVLQIAAHETHFGLERLYDLCLTVRRLVDPLKIGRVIARPFVGERSATFQRTHNRRDYAVPPPEPTLLDRLTERGSNVIAVGKIGDIFAHRGISQVRKAGGNMAMFDKALGAMDDAGEGDLVFANFVDFDTEFGHRRDVAGYAAALEAFDRRLPEAVSRTGPGDLLILTADHGNDPTWRGTDHTRERVPVIGIGPGLKGGDIGLRPTFADIGETVADHLGLAAGRHGTSFLATIGGHA
ncbi:MAG: phosphopentomutase [Mesorhizobium sp.]|jgi:phosphopentomutase|uniref:phosphopentomutase n=1 Tax=Mesorhizobium sp. TaxID=1871066 RepID=UPI000FE2BB68|nr:phosphopentomutase [Mesorhizobium sp.]RWH71854.1 MAG: phosphopentomutase [Mesorhizobium sp.]RWL32861.1 MAG: phosphopentomutase [Mesorhizobium sp.]RWL33869.1 MAG: phosphopentomutase [Mesorhizobium sp.]RWL39962.1 MAG: phosphopentomutase [Mesorhizobium sp.]RWL51991.1 MAG: phosphopentomutase [Mesorhizobium sp.]